MILPTIRDPRFITIRRGGILTDADHRLIAMWAATCASHVLPLFEAENPCDARPRTALELLEAWLVGGVSMTECRSAGGHAMAAGRNLKGATRFAAYAAGQAACVPHVAAHELGAAAYAIRAVRASVDGSDAMQVGRMECQWQRMQLPESIRDLVLEDQRARNDICWRAFDC